MLVPRSVPRHPSPGADDATPTCASCYKLPPVASRRAAATRRTDARAAPAPAREVQPRRARGRRPRARPRAPRRAGRTQVGRLLRAEGLVPDLALCSTATRAKRTWELAAAELDARSRSATCAPSTWRPRAVCSRPCVSNRPMSAAPAGRPRSGPSRPGDGALGEGEPGLLAALRAEFPTAALARIAFDAADWADIAAGAGRLLAYRRPRERD